MSPSLMHAMAEEGVNASSLVNSFFVIFTTKMITI
jgi:hypothetical protein